MVSGSALAAEICTGPHNRLLRRQHCRSLCSQSEGHEHVANMVSALGHNLVIFQPMLGRRNIRPPHFASKVSYSAGASKLRRTLLFSKKTQFFLRFCISKVSGSALATEIYTDPHNRLLRRQHCSSLCSQSEGHEHVANMISALGHNLVIFQPMLGRRNIRPPHFASKVSYSAGADNAECGGGADNAEYGADVAKFPLRFCSISRAAIKKRLGTEGRPAVNIRMYQELLYDNLLAVYDVKTVLSLCNATTAEVINNTVLLCRFDDFCIVDAIGECTSRNQTP